MTSERFRRTSVFVIVAVVPFVGCAGCSSENGNSRAKPLVVAAVAPAQLAAKPGDDLGDVISQALDAYDAAGTRLGVLVVHRDSFDPALLIDVEPYLTFDEAKRDDALAAIATLKERYPLSVNKVVIDRLEDMWTCPEEVIGFKIRSGNKEIVFSKGPPLLSGDWEILDLSRRADNVAGAITGQINPSKAVELFEAEPVPEGSPRFLEWYRTTKKKHYDRAGIQPKPTT